MDLSDFNIPTGRPGDPLYGMTENQKREWYGLRRVEGLDMIILPKDEPRNKEILEKCADAIKAGQITFYI